VRFCTPNYDFVRFRALGFVEQAEKLVEQSRVKAPGLTASMSALSGGNVQRAVLARELTQNVRLLIASNPTFGLDFVACEETYRRIVEARNGGAAVLLVSEDLDELLGLTDSASPGLKGAIDVFGQNLPSYDVFLMIIGRVVLGALWLLFHRTRWAVLVRAATQHRGDELNRTASECASCTKMACVRARRFIARSGVALSAAKRLSRFPSVVNSRYQACVQPRADS
jgi:energy-coupling factor transporter ATP-binding protein EcfA2